MRKGKDSLRCGAKPMRLIALRTLRFFLVDLFNFLTKTKRIIAESTHFSSAIIGDLMISKGKTALTYTAMFLLVTIVSLSACLMVQAQIVTTFTPANQFAIPESNGIVSFSRNGTYQTASLQDGSWFFTNLRLNNASQTNFTVSVQNSNISISTCRYNFENIRPGQISYKVVGQGKQIFNIGFLRPQFGYWTVSINQEFIAENHGWSSSSNGTVTVTGAASGSNVTIYYTFGANVNVSNQPFLQQHSLIIETGIAVAAVVVFALAVREVNLRKQKENPDSNLVSIIEWTR